MSGGERIIFATLVALWMFVFMKVVVDVWRYRELRDRLEELKRVVEGE